MRVIDAVPGSKIYVGQQIEINATMVRFDASPFYQLYGRDGTFSLRIQRYGEAEGYPVGYPLVFAENGYVCWRVSQADVAIAGDNEVQVEYITESSTSMSMKWIYVARDSIVLGETVPAPMKEWAEAILDAAAEIVPMPEDMVRVPTTDTLDTVLGIEDGEVKQASLDDLKTAMGVPTAADEISFDPDATQLLEAETVQDAVDELATKMSGIATPTYQYVSGSESVPDSTITQVCSYTIPTSGLWLVVSKLSFSVSGTSAYNHYIFYGNNNTVVRGNMTSGGGTTNAYVGILSEGTEISARAYQTSGSAITCNADLALVRLGNSPT